MCRRCRHALPDPSPYGMAIRCETYCAKYCATLSCITSSKELLIHFSVCVFQSHASYQLKMGHLKRGGALLCQHNLLSAEYMNECCFRCRPAVAMCSHLLHILCSTKFEILCCIHLFVYFLQTDSAESKHPSLYNSVHRNQTLVHSRY